MFDKRTYLARKLKTVNQSGIFLYCTEQLEWLPVRLCAWSEESLHLEGDQLEDNFFPFLLTQQNTYTVKLHKGALPV